MLGGICRLANDTAGLQSLHERNKTFYLSLPVFLIVALKTAKLYGVLAVLSAIKFIVSKDNLYRFYFVSVTSENIVSKYTVFSNRFWEPW